ncbi:DUF5694 domain-containing protein [Gramella jeungdoensis]|uniref:DUF5694 domain-containing protein n=1 Tax=Gramella jeungdoensis TaxID=708091 RepID=A0ABT0YZU5_9FLAO|nr:DUF5694 domain-containing protein [Gramella jeungdoensis]MCM8568545.1 DUF5694 domain-containing protein [Gramella jeungdoensis]
MKKLTSLIVVLILLTSCKKQIDQTAEKNQEAGKLNRIAAPNQFIGKNKSQAMVLGVFHFSNASMDSYKKKFSFNILEEKRQAELDTLIEKIAAYRPTKILIEVNRVKYDSIINSRFEHYLSNSYSIEDKSNEVYQIGFKLAKKLGHHKVYCSDATAEWFGVQLDWDNYDGEEYMKSRGQYLKANRYDYNAIYRMHDSLKTQQSLTDHLIMLNHPESRLKDHQAYLTGTILAGAGDNYLGADSVGKWYRRNLRIFANAYDLTDFENEERLLLIYGSGHVWQLRQFFMDSPDYDYVEPNDYLTE